MSARRTAGVPASVAGRARLHAWVLASRPATLPAAVGPVLVGLGLAVGHGAFRPLAAAASLVVAVLLQVGANLANDLFDYLAGADSADRLGPPRAAALGLLSARQLAAGTALVLAAAAVAGLYLVSVGGLPILVLGGLALVSAVAYTGGPLPYGYLGLGELFVFAFFGLAGVAGTAYLQLGSLPALALAASVPSGTLVTAILVANNLRDIETDRRAGKRTFAVRFGERASVLEYDALVATAYAVPVLLLATSAVTLPALLPLLSAPLVVPLLRVVHAGGDPRRLNGVLRGTARASLAFAVLFALGLATGTPR